MTIRLAVFVVGPRTAIVVRHQQYAAVIARIEPSHDIAYGEFIAVEGADYCILHKDCITSVTREFADKKLGATPVSISTGHTRSHLHLTAYILVCAVSSKFHLKLCRLRRLLHFCFITTAVRRATSCQDHGDDKHYVRYNRVHSGI